MSSPIERNPSYTWTRLAELPGGPGIPVHYFPSDRCSGQDGLILQISPDQAAPWIGLFAFGRFGTNTATEVLPMPNADQLCVVASGSGYIVWPSSPLHWSEVEISPVVDVRRVPSKDLIVFADFTQLVAYDQNGPRWATERLSWDGFKILEVSESTLVGEYWDIRDEAVRRFEVDLNTGTARGGAGT